MQEDAQQQQQQAEEDEQIANNDTSSPSVTSTDEQYEQMRLSNRELPSPPSVYAVVNTWLTILRCD